MNAQNICFSWKRKIIPELSSDTHLICFSVRYQAIKVNGVYIHKWSPIAVPGSLGHQGKNYEHTTSVELIRRVFGDN